jgi:putative membrane-bound dehydrogenase-like protein
MKKIGALIAVAVVAGVVLWNRGSLKEKRGLESVTVPEGFTVELAAKPGLVKYPMLGTIAPDGAIYMCESSGRTYKKTPEMSADPTYVVTKIEDTDGDGIYDKSTVFADKLTLPAGAVWYKDSLYVTAPPYLYRFQDTNGDGVADVKEVVVQGWNLSANAASLHGPIMGPDGWLYLTDGRHGFKIDTKDNRHHEGMASRIWRVRPDGTGLEWYAGGGFDNPVEVVFTEGGDMFGTMTYFRDPADGQRDSILHFVEGGCYPKPHPSTAEFKRTGDLMPVMTKFARIAPAGLLRYKGPAFGADFQGNLLSAHFNAHRVQRHKVSRIGATYKTEDEDFFVASDPDLHPTDVMEEPDGNLIVVDTGAWFIHGCPLSRVAKPDIQGMLYRVRKKGAKPEKPNLKQIFADEDPKKLAALLDDPRAVVAEEAANRLVWAGGKAVGAASEMRVNAKTVGGASAAVFVLYRLGATAAVREALKDSRMEVRQAAARSAGMMKDGEAVAALMEMVKKEDAPVRRQAAAALGQIGDGKAVPALLAAAANPEDRFVEHSVIYSLIQLKDGAAMSKLLSDSSPKVRKAVLIALDQMDGSPLKDAQVLPFISDSDAELRRTGLWVVSRHKEWSAKLTEALDLRLRSPQFNESESEMIGEAMAAYCGDANMKKAVAKALGDDSLDSKRQLFLLETAERCSSRQFPEEWTEGLKRLLAHKDVTVRVKTIGLARARGVTTLDADLRRLADSTAEPDDIRVAALSALGSRSPKLSEQDFAYLIGRTMPKVDASAKLAAGQVLGRAEFSEEQLMTIAQRHMKAADPLVLPNLLDAFRNNTSEQIGMTLLKALGEIESSLGTVGSQRVAEIVKKYPAAVRTAARTLIARIDKDKNSRLEKLVKLERTLTARGDVEKGREIFFGAKAGCSSCHTVGERGGHVGPDLTSIGAIRSPHDLLEAIVLPSESFVPGFEVWRIETAREVYSGVRGRGSPDAERLITGPGDEVRIPRKEIKKMGFAPVSLMPEGFDEVLSKTEMTDLIAYMRAQTSRKAAGVNVTD